MPRTIKQAYGITLTSFLVWRPLFLFYFFQERSIIFGVCVPYVDLLTNQIILS
jgi:hypothetical protein